MLWHIYLCCTSCILLQSETCHPIEKNVFNRQLWAPWACVCFPNEVLTSDVPHLITEQDNGSQLQDFYWCFLATIWVRWIHKDKPFPPNTGSSNKQYLPWNSSLFWEKLPALHHDSMALSAESFFFLFISQLLLPLVVNFVCPGVLKCLAKHFWVCMWEY